MLAKARKHKVSSAANAPKKGRKPLTGGSRLTHGPSSALLKPRMAKRKLSRAQRQAALKNLEKARRAKKRKKACRKAAGKRGGKAAHCKVMPKYPKRCKTKKYAKSRKSRLKRGPSVKCRKPGYRKVKTVRLAARSSTKKKGHRKSKGHRSHASYVAAGKKAARTRKAGKRSHGKKSGSAKRKSKSGRSHRSYVLAGKKAARTRASKRGYTPASHQLTAGESPRKRRKSRKGRRKNPIVNPLPNPRRRHRRHMNRYRNPLFGNPLDSPMEIVQGIFGVGLGYVLANLGDRFLSTHPLTVSGTSVTDTPAAGQIYDSEAPLLPLWNDPMRMAWAAGIVFAPGLLSRLSVLSKFKSFFQLASYGSAAFVGGKLINDTIATFGASQPLVLQAFGPEIAAQNRLSQISQNGGVIQPLMQQSGGTATQPAGFFAGAPRTGGPTPHENTGAPRQLAAMDQTNYRTMGDPGCSDNCGGPGNCGCQNCNTPISTDPVAQAGDLLGGLFLDKGTLHWPTSSDPSDPGSYDPYNPPIDCAPPDASQLPAPTPAQCPPGSFPAGPDASAGCFTPGSPPASGGSSGGSPPAQMTCPPGSFPGMVNGVMTCITPGPPPPGFNPTLPAATPPAATPPAAAPPLTCPPGSFPGMVNGQPACVTPGPPPPGFTPTLPASKQPVAVNYPR
jgi:hypothetical protein